MAYAESQIANQKTGNLKFYAPFNERAVIGWNLVGISKKRFKKRIKQELKVSTLDIQIKRSG